MSELEKYIEQYFGFNREEIQTVSAWFHPVVLKKGDYFLKAGRMSDRLGFVQKGIVREFFASKDEDVTKWIATPGYFVVDLASFIFRVPARWNFQALTDCELYVIDQQAYAEIGRSVARWAELEKLFIAKCFTVLEDRILTHLSMTAEERYHQLYNFNSSLFNTVPLQYLASMLGMSPETLSRLRKKQLH